MERIKRKLKKLIRDPKLFFKDMKTKHTNRVKSALPIKYAGNFEYTVVSAVYNVGKYLDQYFDSLVNQTLSFKKHIHLILVDDGSTDNSAAIIKKWQKKYPNNITYIYKENGGISSARNLGLQHVKTKWVTFIDSDDFVHSDYFRIIDKTLHEDSSIKLVAGNLKFFFEDNQLVQDSHSLRFRFEKEKNIVPINNLDRNINLFVTVSFFQTEILHKNSIIFDEKIKPNFEDGKFLADYFLHTEDGYVAYLQKAVFFYRKRGDGSSTIDGAWSKKGKFDDVFSFGYIPMLESYKNKYGVIPKNIQWTVLYELGWHLKTLVNNDFKLEGVLSDEEISNYHNLVCQTLSYIDERHIIDFDLIGIWFLYKVGMMGLKGKKTPFNIAYIENVDKEKKQILIAYQYVQDHSVSFCLDNQDIIPRYYKIADYSFAKRVFVHEVRAWIPYKSLDSQFTIVIDGKAARLSLFGRQHNGWKVADILSRFEPSEKYKTDGSWIIMDRDTQADDNGEHFYRYMKKHHPEQKCYFALRKNSHDWKRLQAEGFSLLDFGSKDYETKLRKASKIISSHFDEYVQDYFGDEYEHSKKFIFLQHGVIQNDLSRFMNRKRNMLIFVTSTQDEYNSIAGNHTAYKVGKKEVLLSGLARHDSLLNDNVNNGKIILIMPTWRSSIIGQSTKVGNAREFNPNFMQTTYAKHWGSFLCSSQLKMLSEKYGYQIVFAPHANIEPYLHLFELPEYIKTWSATKSTMSIQRLFQTSTLMITDYSSVSFEMGFLEKPVLYYQFDKNEIFSGTHIIRRGYFDYERDGFGPVAYSESELLNHLGDVLKNNGKSLEPYASRAKNTFPFRDGKNCERIYNAIIQMDKPEQVDSLSLLKEFTEQAYRNADWSALEQRSRQINEIDDVEIYQDYYFLSLFKQNKFAQLHQEMAKSNNKDYWQAKTGLIFNDERISLNYFAKNMPTRLDDKILVLLAAAFYNDKVIYAQLKKQLSTEKIKWLKNLLAVSDTIYQKDWQQFDKLSTELLNLLTIKEKREYKFELLFSYYYNNLGNFEQSNNCIWNYWKHTKNDCTYFFAAAMMAFGKGEHNRVVSELAQGFKGNYSIFSKMVLSKFAHSLNELAKILKSENN